MRNKNDSHTNPDVRFDMTSTTNDRPSPTSASSTSSWFADYRHRLSRHSISSESRPTCPPAPTSPTSPSSPSSSVMRFLSKPNRQLQLPSFKSLGIAAPKPDQLSYANSDDARRHTQAQTQSQSSSQSQSQNQSHPQTQTQTQSSPSSSSLPDVLPSELHTTTTTTTATTATTTATTASLSLASNSPNLSKMDLSYAPPLPITPPESDGSIKWNPDRQSTDSSNNHIPDPPPPAVSDSSDPDIRHFSSSHTTTPQQIHLPNHPPPPSQPLMDTSDTISGSLPLSLPDRNPPPVSEDNDRWFRDGIEMAASSLQISRNPGEAVKLVSQTLPCPPQYSSDSVSHPCAFTPIVQAIQSRLQPDQSPYINIVHAVPPMFSLSSLPTSPPSTPNRLSPGDDYFNSTVFSSATSVPGYPYTDSGSEAQETYTPAPIVPPYSVHVAVVERYLPPPSPQEYQSTFSSLGPSVLLDRLRELSPKGGNLILIYPTAQGAQTFKRHYLAPILDPLLRQLVVVNGLSADIGMALGHMPTVSHMDDYDTMQSKLFQLCRELTDRQSTSPVPPPTKFELVYSAKGNVELDRKRWVEWYIQQETPRAKEILNKYWRNGYRLSGGNMASTGNRSPAAPEVTPQMLLREILEGLRKRSETEPPDVEHRIELGVFIIKRSH